jgi:hypothetical protein
VRVYGGHALGVLVLDGPVPFVEDVADLLVGVVRRHFCALLVFVYRRVAFGAGPREMWAVMRTLPRREGLPE